MHTIGDLKNSVSGLLTGTTLDNITNLYGAIERAARVLVQKADIPEASGRQSITLYDGVFDYTAPTTIFGTALTDFRPQGNSRTSLDVPYKTQLVDFDRTKNFVVNGYKLGFEYRKGTAILRVSSPNPTPREILDAMTDDDGWTAAGSASGLIEDETVYYDSPVSLRFTLTGSSTGTLTKTISQVDMDKYEDVGVAFLAIRIPDGATASQLTSIALRLCNSSTVYDEVSDTDGFLGAWVVGEWLLVAFDFSGATSTGTPDWNAIDYVQIRLAHTATLTNFRVGGLWISLPSPHEVLFQSPALFLVSSTVSATITDDNDTIILNDAAYTLFEYEVAVTISEQSTQGKPNGGSEGYKSKLDKELYPIYRADNPSEELRTISNWYYD